MRISLETLGTKKLLAFSAAFCLALVLSLSATHAQDTGGGGGGTEDDNLIAAGVAVDADGVLRRLTR